MDWSHGLLSKREGILFRRLSVFAGGFVLEAAEVVGAGGDIEGSEVLDLLDSMVDKSLVMVEEREGEARYRLLETVRQFGREKLEESGEASEILRRHAGYYLVLAEEAEPELLGPDQGLWLQRLRSEFANLREARAWSLEPGQEPERARLGLRLAAALWRFWAAQRFEEGKRWLEMALERDPGGLPAVRAKALNGLSHILLFQQDYERAMAALEEAVVLYKEIGDESGAALALANLGYAALHGGYRERVPAFVREGEALMAVDLDGHTRAFLRMIVATAALGEGDLDSAEAQFEEGMALSRELGDLRNTAMSLFNLGMIEVLRRELDRGEALFQEGARLAREIGDRLGSLYYVWGFGKLSALRGRPVRAARLWGAAETLREQPPPPKRPSSAA
jgi:non-specific serine/threonine protein kinase